MVGNELYILAGVFALGFFVILFFYISYKSKTNQTLQDLKNQLTQQQIDLQANEMYLLNLKEDLELKKQEVQNLQTKNEELLKTNSKNEAELEALKQTHKKLQDEFEEQSKKLELKLNEIMQNSLDSKIKKFDENSLKSLENILKPFKEDINEFKKKVQISQEASIKRFAELSKEIEYLGKMSSIISEDAKNLTQALRGKKQSQGAWGEMILDSVLEYSGLLKGVHYEKQTTYRDENNEIKKPDVIIKLPGSRSIIIDSKVSLIHYEEYIKAQDEVEKISALKNLTFDFKNQIDLLSSKDYTHYDIGTLQYVFMFVPIEGAFASVIQYDSALYEYALKKHIAIVTPSTLTVSLRTIYLYWQSEQSNKFALKLFDEAGKLYDKVAIFAKSFEKLGNQLNTLEKSYQKAYEQLATGGGNVLKRVSNLKALGAKTTKNLSDIKIEYDDFDEEKITQRGSNLG